MTHGQAKLLREHGITTTRELAQAIEHNAPGWRLALNTSHQLRAESAVLYARAEALQASRPVLAKDRVSALMPAWSDMNIYLTVHFDMGTGISFAFGAKRVYFQPGR
jgi:predicted RecB family nuclease